jgi:hypothetical protein
MRLEALRLARQSRQGPTTFGDHLFCPQARPRSIAHDGVVIEVPTNHLWSWPGRLETAAGWTGANH